MSLSAVVAACSSDGGVRSGESSTATSIAVVPTTMAAPSTAPAATSTTPAPTTEPPPPAAEGVGDPLFPGLGFTGIDVRHYDVALSYDPALDTVDAVVGIDLVATTELAAFTLDAVGLEVRSVTLDGADVEYRTGPTELEVRPAAPLPAGTEANVAIGYTARPNAEASVAGIPNGWFHTPDGSYVLNEPDGARTWMPCNDHPIDKATFTFDITVPAGLSAIANGALAEHTSGPEGERWVWQETDPMATYLIQLLTGRYTVQEATAATGLPLVNVAVEGTEQVLDPYTAITGQQLAFFEQYFGPYPLDRYGVAISDSFGGLAMETQGRSLFSREDMLGGLDYLEHLLLAHELAHQWYGNAVTPARWGDIWLNESFATYAEWMWLEEAGFDTVDGAAQAALDGRGPGATASPGAADLFSFNSYQGGAVVLHALRRTIGDDAFFTLLRRWVQENAGTSRTTEEFVAMAQEVAGEDLGAFFDEWLFATPPRAFPPGQ